MVSGSWVASESHLSALERSLLLMSLSVLLPVTNPSTSSLSATFDQRQERSTCLEGLKKLVWPLFLFLSLQTGEEVDALLMACGPHHVELADTSGGKRT